MIQSYWEGIEDEGVREVRVQPLHKGRLQEEVKGVQIQEAFKLVVKKFRHLNTTTVKFPPSQRANQKEDDRGAQDQCNSVVVSSHQEEGTSIAPERKIDSDSINNLDFASPFSKVGAVEGRSIVMSGKDLKKEKVSQRIFELGLKHIRVWKVGKKNGMQHWGVTLEMAQAARDCEKSQAVYFHPLVDRQSLN
ncbi:hypothetical protein QOT17_024040 [Balamuthia mandrillaris]